MLNLRQALGARNASATWGGSMRGVLAMVAGRERAPVLPCPGEGPPAALQSERPVATPTGQGTGRIAFEGSSFDLTGDADDPYFLGAPENLRSQVGLCGVLRACLCNEASVVLDIGANIGLSTLAMSTVLPPGGRIIAFEPSPRNAAHLRRNLAVNGRERVRVVEAAMGAERGLLQLHEASSGSASHLVTDRHLSGAGSVQVRVETLDAFVAEGGVDRIDFVKIDVEGWEPDVLAGAREALHRFCPVTFVEFNSWTLMAFRNMNPREFLDLLRRDFPFVSALGPDGTPEPLDSDHAALAFLHRNLIQHGCVDDLILSYQALPAGSL